MKVYTFYFLQLGNLYRGLGFSPFELVFRHADRGPLKLLKEKILSQEDIPLNLLQYVFDFRSKLSTACEAAKSNLKRARGKIKL